METKKILPFYVNVINIYDLRRDPYEALPLTADVLFWSSIQKDPGNIFFKPGLRRISDLTNHEKMQIFRDCIHPGRNYPESDYKFSISASKTTLVISIDNDWYSEGIRIGVNSGAIWSNSQRSHFRAPASIYFTMIGWGVDLFNAIDLGFAIEVKQVDGKHNPVLK